VHAQAERMRKKRKMQADAAMERARALRSRYEEEEADL
jgi:hypothetical protein